MTAWGKMQNSYIHQRKKNYVKQENLRYQVDYDYN